jgi:hypothetical protein
MVCSALSVQKRSVQPDPLNVGYEYRQRLEHSLTTFRNVVEILYEEYVPALQKVLSQSSIFGQNPKIGCQEFNDLQTPKLSKKQLCDRTA